MDATTMTRDAAALAEKVRAERRSGHNGTGKEGAPNTSVPPMPDEPPKEAPPPLTTVTAAAATEARTNFFTVVRERVRAYIGRAIDLSDLFPPGTKEIRGSQVFRTPVSRWIWRLATHRITRAGHWFLGLTCLLALFGAISLEIQTYIPFLYVGALWLVGGVYAVFSRPRVELHVRHAGAITAGETLAVDVEVKSTRRRGLLPAPDLNVLPEFLPMAIDTVPGTGAPVPPLTPGASARVRLGLLCKRRGVYALKGWRVETDFPLGILNAYRVFRQNVSLIVYPAFQPLNRFSLPPGARNLPGGVALTAHLGDSFEFLGNREFRQGDSIRDIDWRATARQPQGMPIVREWREEFFFRVGVILDTYRPEPRRSRASDREARRAAFERAVSTCAALSDWLARNDYVVDIFAAGPDLYHLTAGRGAAYLDQILDILACIEPAPPGEEPLAKIEPELLALLGRLTTVVCVFTDYGEGRRAFVRTLRENGVGVKVVLTPPEGMPVPDLPTGEDATVLEASVFANGGGPEEI